MRIGRRVAGSVSEGGCSGKKPRDCARRVDDREPRLRAAVSAADQRRRAPDGRHRPGIFAGRTPRDHDSAAGRSSEGAGATGRISANMKNSAGVAQLVRARVS